MINICSQIKNQKGLGEKMVFYKKNINALFQSVEKFI